MALTGLEIYKRLPKTNCKDCGVPTCLAFAMKVAAGQAALTTCPHLTGDARSQLDEASAPPQRLVRIGAPCSIELGQETVLFRHEEKFHRPPAVALRVSDALSSDALRQVCTDFRALAFQRVGETLRPDMFAVVNESGSADTLCRAAEALDRDHGVPQVLMSESVESLAAAATGPLAGKRPLLYCTRDASVHELVQLAKQADAPLCIAGDLASVADRVEQLGAQGVKDIVISPGRASTAATLNFLTQTRRASLKKKFRPLGCPVLATTSTDDPASNALDACAFICKYAGIVVTDAWQPPMLVTILTTRQSIYTDPQRPVQVEPKLHEIGDVTPQSPLLVTTNFSLSYYSVESQVESARLPCFILAVDTEGTSVLTSWASDKFNAATISAALKASNAEQRVTHRKVVIPGLVAVLASPLADESGWKVLVGPKEATGIGPYLKSDWSAA